MVTTLRDIFPVNRALSILKRVIGSGAIILDVRTSAEFSTIHIKGAKNIPLDRLPSKISQIKSWNQPVVVCGDNARSMQARILLSPHGVEVYDAGLWSRLIFPDLGCLIVASKNKESAELVNH